MKQDEWLAGSMNFEIELRSVERLDSPRRERSLAIITINGWNRLAISFRAVPGSYQRKTFV
jgi:hypothetical protein